MIVFRSHGWCSCFLSMAALLGQPHVAVPAEAEAAGKVRIVPIGPGYALNHVNVTSFNRHNLVSNGEWQFAAYYNDAEKVTVARRRLGETEWQLFPTSLVARDIRDVHDVVSIALDGPGYLHMSWGMHGHDLNYVRSVAPVTGETPIAFGPRGYLIGRQQRVTYPEFLSLPDGGLLFMLREGTSGDGDTYLNRYDPAAAEWKPVHVTDGTRSPFLKGGGRKPNASAYPNNLVLDSRRRLHAVWTWRYNDDSPAGQHGYQTNHDLVYACSPDFGRTWTRIDGTPCRLPIRDYSLDQDSPGAPDVAVSIPEGSSLINTTSLTTDRRDRPVIASWWAPKAGAGDHTRQYMLAWHDGNRWRTSQISRRTPEFDVDGDGRSDPIPESRLRENRMLRPIVVVDRADRIIVVFNDHQQGQRVTAAWSDDRVNWRFINLTDEKLGAWEPTYDVEIWRRQNRLHMLYQCVGVGAGSSTVSVLEWDSRTTAE